MKLSLRCPLPHTVMTIKVNWISASRWCSKVIFFFCFFILQVYIFSILPFAGLGTHFRAPKHVYITWNKDEEVSGERNYFFDYTYFLSGGLATEQVALYFFVNCIFQFILLYLFLVVFFVLSVHEPLHLSYWICWITECSVCLRKKKNQASAMTGAPLLNECK